MRLSRVVAVLMLFILCAAGVAAAADEAKSASKVPADREVAVYAVPKLMEGTVLKDLAKALADAPGVLLAQVDKEKGTFNVTFETKKTDPEALLKTIQTVSKDATLEAITAADGKSPAGKDCGKCPHSKACPSTKKSE